MYQLLSGRPPFPDANLINQMVRHATETPQPLPQSNPDVPDGLQQIVSYMIAKQPAQRYPNPERAAQALQVFLMAESRQPRPPEDSPRMRSYLTWLENAPAGNGADIPVAQPVVKSTKAPRQTPIPRATPTAPALPRPSSKRSRNNRPASVPVAKPAPQANSQEFDVELVPVAAQTPATIAAGPKALGLTGREWKLVAGVAASSIVILVIGLLIVWLK